MRRGLLLWCPTHFWRLPSASQRIGLQRPSLSFHETAASVAGTRTATSGSPKDWISVPRVRCVTLLIASNNGQRGQGTAGGTARLPLSPERPVQLWFTCPIPEQPRARPNHLCIGTACGMRIGCGSSTSRGLASASSGPPHESRRYVGATSLWSWPRNHTARRGNLQGLDGSCVCARPANASSWRRNRSAGTGRGPPRCCARFACDSAAPQG